MNEIIEEFFNKLVQDEKEYGNFQAGSLFNQLKGTNMEKNQELVFDFYHYLFTHDIIRYGLDFNNIEPFTTFTRFGRTLIENEARRIAMFEEFLKIHNYSW